MELIVVGGVSLVVAVVGGVSLAVAVAAREPFLPAVVPAPAAWEGVGNPSAMHHPTAEGQRHRHLTRVDHPTAAVGSRLLAEGVAVENH